jgi:hypothetical protein
VVADGRPVGREEHDVVARIHRRLEGTEKPVRSTAGDDDVLRIGHDPVRSPELGDDRVEQLGDAGGRRIAGLVGVERVLHGLLDELRRRLEGLAPFET